MLKCDAWAVFRDPDYIVGNPGNCSERKHCLHPRMNLLRGAIYEKNMSHRIIDLSWKTM